MTTQPPEEGHFQAGRDNHGAFATGPGAIARNIGPGAVYIEKYNEFVSNKPLFQSLLPDKHQSIVLNDKKYLVQTVDAMLIEARRSSKPVKESNGVITVHNYTHLFFRKADGYLFDRIWPSLDFSCPLNEWITFLVIEDVNKENIDSFCLHNTPESWYAWVGNQEKISVDLPEKENIFIVMLFMNVSIAFLASITLNYHVNLSFCLIIFVVMACCFFDKRERRRLNHAIKSARQAVQFCRLEQ